jgi:predicted Rossmann fold flavoprotein
MKEGMSFDSVILGGGAGGLFCALTAAKRGSKVLVLERSNKLGKKILMSGGGKCNFTNYDVSNNNFLSDNIHFCKSALSKYTSQDFIDLVKSHGIEFEEKKHGQLFCVNSAKDIVEMLKSECDKYKVSIITHAETEKVGFVDNKYNLDIAVDNKIDNYAMSVKASKLVVATGALSVPTLGGSAFGYQLAKQFGLEIIKTRAGLVPFIFTDILKETCKKLSGVSHFCKVSCNKKSFTEDILFTHRGLSGPAILQISNYWNEGDAIKINLFPDIDIKKYIFDYKKNTPKQKLKSVFTNIMSKSLVEELASIFWNDHKDIGLAEISNQVIADISNQLTNWVLLPATTEGYRTAEVTLCGVNTKHLSSKNMEVKNQKGLYFIGEVLDVTGHLGGFNFQWAWSSAYAAGCDI